MKGGRRGREVRGVGRERRKRGRRGGRRGRGVRGVGREKEEG